MCLLNQISYSDIDFAELRNTTGMCLLQLKKQDFSSLCGEEGGPVFYKALRALRKKTGGKTNPHPHEDALPHVDPSLSSLCPPSLSPYALDSEDWSLSTEEYNDLDRYIPGGENWNSVPDDISSLVVTDDVTDDVTYDVTGDQTEEDEDDDVEDRLGAQQEGDYDKTSLPCEGANEAICQKIKTTSRRGDRNPKIWEFLLRLLVDPRTNPHLVRWHDISSATFVLVQPGLIAQLWGTRSKKPNLSANNFARSLRYHYTTGALVAVSERHYMYRCGKKALQFLAGLQGGALSSEAGK
ncbi:protein C-ets-2-like [Palaemon carinicauda]|uniref:protein C-ets-2-like n=1 Tax=Palaemon carinicauda TaxID=392227 RepID=UPI0035B674E6